MQIRTATLFDLESLRQLQLAAFPDEGEAIAELVLNLMTDETAQPLLILVAEVDAEVVGCVIFSAVHIEDAANVPARILAPLAVAPGHQRQGIGRALVEHGLGTLRAQGMALVFVLGDPRYYARFGFSPRHRVRAPYDLPYPEAWMALPLQPGALESVSGQLACARSMNKRDLW